MRIAVRNDEGIFVEVEEIHFLGDEFIVESEPVEESDGDNAGPRIASGPTLPDALTELQRLVSGTTPTGRLDEY